MKRNFLSPLRAAIRCRYTFILVFYLFILPPVFCIAQPKGELAGSGAQTEFNFNKGINIGAWLSQTSVTSGQKRIDFFTEGDLRQLASLGFDHIRLPVSESQLYTIEGKKNEETFQIIHRAISWCKKANLRIILDCHELKVSKSRVVREGTISLWTDTTAQDNFIKLWKDLSVEFGGYPENLLAYELLNEPDSPDPETWNRISTRAILELRKLEPKRVLLLASNKSNSVTTFPLLTFPRGDPNIILSFHFYHPALLTHYQAGSVARLKNVNLPLCYPGKLVSDEVVDTLNDEAKLLLKTYNGTYNKERLLEKMATVLQKAKETGLRIHCGEFGANFKYPNLDLQLRWVQDLVANFKAYNIPYTVWGYRATFGVFNDSRKVKDQRYLDALVR